MNYNKMTVPQLRSLCKERGLRVYRNQGKRLLKKDLVNQLVDSDGGLSVTVAELAGIHSYSLWELCCNQDRYFDPAASRRECVAYLLATEKSLKELSKRKVGRPVTLVHARDGWVDKSRALGVRVV